MSGSTLASGNSVVADLRVASESGGACDVRGDWGPKGTFIPIHVAIRWHESISPPSLATRPHHRGRRLALIPALTEQSSIAQSACGVPKPDPRVKSGGGCRLPAAISSKWRSLVAWGRFGLFWSLVYAVVCRLLEFAVLLALASAPKSWRSSCCATSCRCCVET